MAKVMISLPDELLARIDSEAKRRMTTRSGLLALAVAKELDRHDAQQVDKAIARSRRRFRQAGSFDATDIVRAERDRRP